VCLCVAWQEHQALWAVCVCVAWQEHQALWAVCVVGIRVSLGQCVNTMVEWISPYRLEADGSKANDKGRWLNFYLCGVVCCLDAVL
jgi:hypothetical protein